MHNQLSMSAAQTKSESVRYAAIILSLALVARLTVFVRQRDASEFTTIDMLAALQAATMVFTLVLIFKISYINKIWKSLSKTSIKMIVCYYLFSSVSAVWSPLPLYSLFRAIEYLSQIVLILVIIWHYDDFDRAERQMLFLSFLVVLFGISMIVRLQGVRISFSDWHANHYTASASMVFCYCFGEFFADPLNCRGRLRFYGLGSLFFLLLGTSMASYFATVAGIAVAVFLSKLGRNVFTYLLVSIVLLSGLIMPAYQFEESLSWLEYGRHLKIYAPESVADPTLSLHGRVMLWEHYIQEIKQSPIYGHGFAVSSRLAQIYSTNTHNGLLAVWLGSGLIGFSLVFYGGCRLIREAGYAVRNAQRGAVGCAAALTAGLVNNMSISIIGEQWRAPSFVFIAMLSFHLLVVIQRGETAPTPHRQTRLASMARRLRSASPHAPRSRLAGHMRPRKPLTARRSLLRR